MVCGIATEFENNNSDDSQTDSPKDRNYYINKNKTYQHNFVAENIDKEEENVTQESVCLHSLYSGYVVIKCLTPHNMEIKKKKYKLECYEMGHHIKIIDYKSNNLNQNYIYPVEQLMNLPPIFIDGDRISKRDPNVDIIFGVIHFIRMLKELNIEFKLMEILIISGIPINNAFWNGYYLSIGCGDGSPRTMNPLVSLDIIAHELTHALTEQICNLEYCKESGALNESISDIMGVCLEYYVFKNIIKKRSFEYIEDTSASWSIGENVLIGGLRNMADPWEHEQPRLINDRYYHTNSSDFYGVHINSGIPNYLFYRMTSVRPFYDCVKMFIDALYMARVRIGFVEFFNLLPYFGFNIIA